MTKLAATSRFDRMFAAKRRPANSNQPPARSRTTASGKKRHLVIAAKAPELTVKELEKVQLVNRGIETIDTAVRSLYDVLKDKSFEADEAFHARMAEINDMIDGAVDSLNDTPKHLREVMNYKDYAVVLDRFDSLFAEAAQDMGSAKDFSRDITKIHTQLNKINKQNPFMKMTKGGFIALGASALAATLVGIGAYYLADGDSRVAKYVDQGLNTLSQWGNTIVDWAGDSVDAFKEMIGMAKEYDFEGHSYDNVVQELQERGRRVYDDMPFPESMQDMHDTFGDAFDKKLDAFQEWNKGATETLNQGIEKFEEMQRNVGETMIDWYDSLKDAPGSFWKWATTPTESDMLYDPDLNLAP